MNLLTKTSFGLRISTCTNIGPPSPTSSDVTVVVALGVARSRRAVFARGERRADDESFDPTEFVGDGI